MRKILLSLSLFFLFSVFITSTYAWSGEVILPCTIDLSTCGQEFFNYHNGKNASDCLECACCCDSEYGCIEWSKKWDAWHSIEEYATPHIDNYWEGTLNKYLYTFAYDYDDYSRVWINVTNCVSGEDITYLTVMMWGNAFSRKRVVVNFSDGTTINIPGSTHTTEVAEFYFTSNNVFAYRNGEKYDEKSISSGASITRVTLETYRGSGSQNRGLFDVFSTTPFPIDIPHELPNTETEVMIAYIISHTHLPEYSLSNHSYTLTIKHIGSGEIVDVINLTSRAKRFAYNLTDLTYDTYLVELQKDGATLSTSWFIYYDAVSGCSVNVEKDVYTPLETAKITYHIASPDFSNHQYFLVIESVYGEEVFRQQLTKADEEIEVELNDYDPQLYIASLKRSSSSEILLAYDTFQVAEGVFVEGKTYDAESEGILPSVFVSYCQDYVGCKNTTSDAVNASYQIKDLAVDYEIQVNASKTNYTHNDFTFTPLQNGYYEINLFLLPDASHINVTAPAIVGLTQTYPFRQNVSYATVNIWNDTWNASTTTNSMGYFVFENLTPGTYYLNATRVKFKPSQTYEVELESGEIEYVYILMWEIYNLTIKARDAGTHSTIFEFRAILNDGEQEKETTTGKLNFSVEYGIHKVEVGADNYYSGVEYVYVCGDTEKIFYLTPFEGGTGQGVGISYPPHQVEFACVDVFGNPLAKVYVEATPIFTTTGAWDWLLNLFGIRNESISYYTNQTLNGTTDSRGAITFVMMENVEYEVNFRNESLGINKTIRIYPKADHYTVILTATTSSVVSSEDYITFNLSYEIVGDDINLSLVYNDTLAQTQNLTFFVYNSTTLLYQQNFTNVSNVSVSYTVPYKAGEEYMWGYSAFHSRFGEMGRSRILRIAWFLDLGISRTYCTWIAIAIILFLTAMFSFTTVKFGYVAIPIISLIFAFIGWLPNISIIIIALCLGILAYMSKREKEVGV